MAKGVTALLRGHVDGTDHDRLSSSAEPALKGSLGVPALILGMFTNALHAVSAVALVITSVPETLSEFDLSVIVVSNNLAGGGIWHTHDKKGGGDLRTGTAGISVDGCSLSLPLEMIGFIGTVVVTFIVLGEGLPIPGIDFLKISLY